MKLEAVAEWNGSSGFDVKAGKHSLSAAWGTERKSATPMELFLSSLACCSGVDVVEIIKKMRKRLQSLTIRAEGIRRDEYPQIFTEIHLRYIAVTDATAEEMDRAISLSMNKYCSVRGMIKDEVKIEYTMELHNADHLS